MSTRTKLVLAAAILILPIAAAAEPKVRTDNGVSYVSGGAGDEEKKALEATGERYSLKVTMALTSGHFVGDAQVKIQDSKGQTLVDTVADGPLLYAALQPGTYTVHCSLNGKAQQQTAQITAGKQTQVACSWTSE